MQMLLKRFSLKVALGAALAMGAFALASPAHAGITLYEHADSKGRSFNAGNGYRTSLPGFDNITSSLKVTGGNITATLHEKKSYKGARSVMFKTGSPNLRTWSCTCGGSWNDKASSVH